MSGEKRLCRHDDHRGSALSLWNLVGAPEELDGDDPAITEQLWSYLAHEIAKGSEYPKNSPDLQSPLGRWMARGRPGRLSDSAFGEHRRDPTRVAVPLDVRLSLALSW
ncbi:hypothetical protein [Nakamurella aerolata]|uniref:Uncharacterized protein n=1 Tax=Nakamurella aerolata TaxID=1656892 RepID=A0A849A9J2_9ACTN|nr:hypothetical protein [Nakamurella aerolata]NNG35768.1 hypothetical protein [Nakamurella aerolata]